MNRQHSFREARGIGSAGLKGYQSGGHIPTGIEINCIDLEARRRSTDVFRNPTNQQSRSLTTRLI
jgi:hypothetical protein